MSDPIPTPTEFVDVKTTTVKSGVTTVVSTPPVNYTAQIKPAWDTSEFTILIPIIVFFLANLFTPAGQDVPTPPELDAAIITAAGTLFGIMRSWIKGKAVE